MRDVPTSKIARWTVAAAAAVVMAVVPFASGASQSAPKRVVLKVVPQKVTSWDHRKLGGRY